MIVLLIVATTIVIMTNKKLNRNDNKCEDNHNVRNNSNNTDMSNSGNYSTF